MPSNDDHCEEYGPRQWDSTYSLACDWLLRILSCQSGVWQKAFGSESFGGAYQLSGSGAGTCAVANPKTGGCGCPVGYTGTLVAWYDYSTFKRLMICMR